MGASFGAQFGCGYYSVFFSIYFNTLYTLHRQCKLRAWIRIVSDMLIQPDNESSSAHMFITLLRVNGCIQSPMRRNLLSLLITVCYFCNFCRCSWTHFHHNLCACEDMVVFPLPIQKPLSLWCSATSIYY